MCKVFKNEKAILGESTSVLLLAFPRLRAVNQGEKIILFSKKTVKLNC